MKQTLSKFLGYMSFILLLAAVILTISLRNSSPIIVGSLSEADVQTERFMDAVCNGDFDTAEKLISSSHDLTPKEEHTNPLTKTLWEAYRSNLTYRFHGGCYADDYGLYRDVTITALDLPALMSDLQTRSAIVQSNTDEDQIMEKLAETAADMIARGGYTTERTLTLRLTGHSGDWQIQITPQLIALLQGSMGGA